MSSEAGAVDRAVAWPQYVRDRVRDTYFYFGSSLAATAGTAAAIYRSPAAMNLVIVAYQADSYCIIYFLSS